MKKNLIMMSIAVTAALVIIFITGCPGIEKKSGPFIEKEYNITIPSFPNGNKITSLPSGKAKEGAEVRL